MNIITVPYYSNLFYIRPDTTLNRDSNDYFCPDYVKEITITHFTYIKIERAGKSILSKFAKRYYKSKGYGLFLNATKLSINDDGNLLECSVSRSLDNTTYYSQSQDYNAETDEQDFDKTLENITRYISIRTGDMIAIENEAKKIIDITKAEKDIPVKYLDINFTIKI